MANNIKGRIISQPAMQSFSQSVLFRKTDSLNSLIIGKSPNKIIDVR